MTEHLTCDCCKRSVEVVSEDALCFACETFHVFTTTIKAEKRADDLEGCTEGSDAATLHQPL